MGSPALEIFVLAVAEQYEGRGVGRLLVDWVIRQAAYLHENFVGVRHLILAADPNAIGFYEKMGFQRTDVDGLEQFLPRERCNKACTFMRMDLDFEYWQNHANL